MCSVQLIFSVLRHILISNASNLVMSSFLRVRVSAQYKVALQIGVFTILFLRGIFILLNPPLGNSLLRQLLSHCYPGASILGLRVATPIFWAGGRVRIAGRAAGGSLGSWTG